MQNIQRRDSVEISNSMHGDVAVIHAVLSENVNISQDDVIREDWHDDEHLQRELDDWTAFHDHTLSNEIIDPFVDDAAAFKTERPPLIQAPYYDKNDNLNQSSIQSLTKSLSVTLNMNSSNGIELSKPNNTNFFAQEQMNLTIGITSSNINQSAEWTLSEIPTELNDESSIEGSFSSDDMKIYDSSHLIASSASQSSDILLFHSTPAAKYIRKSTSISSTDSDQCIENCMDDDSSDKSLSRSTKRNRHIWTIEEIDAIIKDLTNPIGRFFREMHFSPKEIIDLNIMHELEDAPRMPRKKYGPRKQMTPEEKTILTRVRNREHAKATRLRKRIFEKILDIRRQAKSTDNKAK